MLGPFFGVVFVDRFEDRYRRRYGAVLQNIHPVMSQEVPEATEARRRSCSDFLLREPLEVLAETFPEVFVGNVVRFVLSHFCVDELIHRFFSVIVF